MYLHFTSERVTEGTLERFMKQDNSLIDSSRAPEMIQSVLLWRAETSEKQANSLPQPH